MQEDREWFQRCRREMMQRGVLQADATFLRVVAFTNQNDTTGNLEGAMLSCDYNGWADVPEEEREGIDAFEYTYSLSVRPLSVFPLIEVPLIPARYFPLPERRAA